MTILSWAHHASSSAPWSSTPSLQRAISFSSKLMPACSSLGSTFRRDFSRCRTRSIYIGWTSNLLRKRLDGFDTLSDDKRSIYALLHCRWATSTTRSPRLWRRMTTSRPRGRSGTARTGPTTFRYCPRERRSERGDDGPSSSSGLGLNIPVAFRADVMNHPSEELTPQVL